MIQKLGISYNYKDGRHNAQTQVLTLQLLASSPGSAAASHQESLPSSRALPSPERRREGGREGG